MSSKKKCSIELTEIVTALKQLSDESNTENVEFEQSYFYVEDVIPAEDLKLKVENVGELKFPIEDETIQKLLQVSSKAKFGKGEATVLDTNFRDTQVIPADKLMVNFEESALAEVLERIVNGLNIDKESTLSIHLHNLLIYGPGQFFKTHRDSEKLPNMVATLVIILPTQHKGGDLIIQHANTKHVFIGSKKSIKCIAFYADCLHNVEKVSVGYRVALTYNVVVEFLPKVNAIPVNRSLDAAVSNYFNSTKNCLLVFLLNHMYTEHSLRWQMLKGNDRTRAQALFAVAEKQGRKPFLALADYHVQTDAEYSSSSDGEVETKLYFWINANNLEVEMSESKMIVSTDVNFESESKGIHVSEDEICYTVKTDDMCEPYETEDEGPTGNEGHPVEYWYRRACVAIWADKWSFSEDYKNSLVELQELMNQSCDKLIVQREIKTNANGFYNTKFWIHTHVVETLLNIVKYLGITEESIQILMKLSPKEVLKLDRVSFITWIENLNDLSTWTKILTSWSSNFLAKEIFDAMIPFMKQKITQESNVVYQLMQEIINLIPKMKMTEYSWQPYWTDSSYFRNFCDLLQICNSLKNEILENKLILTESCKKTLENVKNFIDLEKILLPEPFKRVYSALSFDVKADLFEKIDKAIKSYWSQNEKTLVLEVCSFYKICIKLGDDSMVAVLLEKIKNYPSFIRDVNDYNSLAQSIKPEHFSSAVSQIFFKIVMDNFMKNSAASARSLARNNPKDNIVDKLCSMLKVCVVSNFASSEVNLKEYVQAQKEIFTPICTANLIIKLNETLTVDQFNRFNYLKNYAFQGICDELAQCEMIKNYLEKIRLGCSCTNCKKVENFLKARNLTSLCIKDYAKNRRHVEQQICKIPLRIRQHIKMETVQRGSPQKLKITQPLIDDALINDLCNYKDKLLAFTSSGEKSLCQTGSSVTNKRQRLK